LNNFWWIGLFQDWRVGLLLPAGKRVGFERVLRAGRVRELTCIESPSEPLDALQVSNFCNFLGCDWHPSANVIGPDAFLCRRSICQYPGDADKAGVSFQDATSAFPQNILHCRVSAGNREGGSVDVSNKLAECSRFCMEEHRGGVRTEHSHLPFPACWARGRAVLYFQRVALWMIVSRTVAIIHTSRCQII
jgi:hypothetical protein